MKNLRLLLISLLFCQLPLHSQVMDLSGTWRFSMDPEAVGQDEKWYESHDFDGAVSLPGSMMTNGVGNDVTADTKFIMTIRADCPYYTSDQYARYREKGNVKIPFCLQPCKYYVGQAWYQRDVDVPKDWKDKEIFLSVERCHWKSTLYIDGAQVGTRNDLCAPQQYDVTGFITPGHHVLTMCVSNQLDEIDPGIDSHSVSDHTQGNWNGMAGSICLTARPKVYLDRVDVYPHLSKGKMDVKAVVVNATDKARKSTVRIGVSKETRTLAPGENLIEVSVPLGKDAQHWDEFNPALYTLNASVTASGQTDTKSVTYGCREWSTSDGILKLNGHPAFMRGNVDCCAFPLTGFPPTDVASWEKIFKVYKTYGLNHVRFHSWCPPEAAFEAADKMGLYCYVECSSWANSSTTIGDGKPVDAFMYQESEAIVKAFGNHPSFCMMSYGNEPGGHNHAEYLEKFVSYWKAKDPRRIYTGAAGWPSLPSNDWKSDPDPRIQRWGEGVGSIINASEPSTSYDWNEILRRHSVPVISHEIGQWCVYPDFKEIAKYTGVYKAKNFEIFRDRLKDSGLDEYEEAFLQASGKLQTICYKADIEAALRSKDMGGFELLGLNDFPGQGTALVGVVNVFWEDKGYVDGAEFSHFCSSLVPLARMDKLIYRNDETFKAGVEIADYEKPYGSLDVSWTIKESNGTLVSKGSFKPASLVIGNCQHVGDIEYALSGISKPSRLVLEVVAGTYANSWNFWVFPSEKPAIAEDLTILVTDTLDAAAQKRLSEGGKVLLSLGRGRVAEGMGGEVEVGFSSIFWNTAWTQNCPPHTLGILCNPKSPVLSEFPTEFHSDFQWQDAMSHCSAVRYDKLSPEIEPSVRIIDDWFTARPLAMMFEVKTGGGSLFVSGADLMTDLENRPSASQLRYSILKYMSGDNFSPSVEVPLPAVQKIFR